MTNRLGHKDNPFAHELKQIAFNEWVIEQLFKIVDSFISVNES